VSDGVPGRRAAWQLWVDPVVHGQECARFERFVVAGPDPDDCQLWVGAVGADGYGSFRAELQQMQHREGCAQAA
jgi:hypothetical protein